MNTLVFFAALAGIYILFSFISRKLFFQGKVDSENYMVYNVSSVLEYAQILVFLIVIFFQINSLATTLPIWYEWIIPVIMLLVFLSKSFIVFASRNNYIKVRDNEICYRAGDQSGSIKVESYCFFQGSDLEKGNWMLEIKGSDGGIDTVKNFNLNDLKLQGFRKNMERHFETKNFKKFIRKPELG
jgi:hypothetical protein